MNIKYLAAIIAVAIPAFECNAASHEGVSFKQLVDSDANLPAIKIYKAEQSILNGNYDKAVNFYIDAIKDGQVDAVHNISDIMIKKKVHGETLKNAISTISFIASKDVNLSFFLGVYYKDIVDHPDLSMSFKWFNNALSLGSIQSAPYVAQLVLDGQKDARLIYSYDNAASMLKLAADKGGDSDAAYTLANLLFTTDQGKVQKNLKVAKIYFEKAAIENYKDSTYKIGYMYEYGLGTEPNIEKSITMYNRALETSGAADANNRLARIYLYGKDGIKINKIKGVVFLTRAANMGQIDANGKLGTMYLYGSDGVKVDIDEAIKRLEYAADKGYKLAASTLYNIFKDGLYGVQPNIDLATKYHNKMLSI
ncbi:tetratricopeptide repeat protein [Photobacterium kishitanii]|uniref:Sel1 repeat family protein n=1 Tax=Photobacterium kishitanii TaxID=318456 RepID=A0A2T3KMY6_9GAMM|nr:tetratricopeptide repeat protein [Photobacterium kishitanii]PSV01160.1 hypothetical protein C9J27_03815 [Photobacterium kishitanii]